MRNTKRIRKQIDIRIESTAHITHLSDFDIENLPLKVIHIFFSLIIIFFFYLFISILVYVVRYKFLLYVDFKLTT